MPKYIISFSGEIETEAESAEAASQIAYKWRRFILHSVVQENYNNLGIRRMSIKAMRKAVEVTSEYLQSRPPRLIIKRERPNSGKNISQNDDSEQV